MAEVRISCIVPGCRRTRGDRNGDPVSHGLQWVCGDHWKLVPARIKRRRSLVKRVYRRRYGSTAWWEYPAGSDQRIDAVKLSTAWARAWRLCVRAAIERGVGI